MRRFHATALRLPFTLFACTAQTLAEFAANPKWMGATNGTLAFSLVLHTWTQDLQRHIHVHAVMACGVLAQDGNWSVPTRKPDFPFPVWALSKVFRGKFVAALATAHHGGDLAAVPLARQGMHGVQGVTRQQQICAPFTNRRHRCTPGAAVQPFIIASHGGCEAFNPLLPPAAPAVQSNKVYLLREAPWIVSASQRGR